jgi:recombination protein RecT
MKGLKMTELTKKTDAPITLRQELQNPRWLAEFGKVLPKHLTPERMVRVALTTLTRTPKLAECTQASFFQCLLTLSQLGLEPDGRRAHLIPYGKDCTLIIDYKGLVELIMRGGNVSRIHADIVHENDDFDYDKGQVIQHRPCFHGDRGKVVAAYAFCQFKDGAEKSELMLVDEIEAIQKRSRSGTSGPWKTDWKEMAKKTVFRRLSKWLPFSPEQRDVIERDDEPLTSRTEHLADTLGSRFEHLESDSVLTVEAVEEGGEA